MPYTTEWENHGVYWRYRGEVSGEEMIRSNQEIYGDERFDRMKYQIVDLTRVEAFDVTPDDMLKMAAYDRAAARSNPRVKVAVIAHVAPIKSLATLYVEQNQKSPWETRMFETVEEARLWTESA